MIVTAEVPPPSASSCHVAAAAPTIEPDENAERTCAPLLISSGLIGVPAAYALLFKVDARRSSGQPPAPAAPTAT